MTRGELIEELLRIDARLEKSIAAKDETLACGRETNRLVEQERKRFKELALADELRRLRKDAAE